MISLSEKLLLLALHDEKGHILMSSSDALPYGLAGAVLLELSMQKKINLVEKKVMLVDKRPTGDEILDEAIVLIRESSKPRTMKYWIEKFHGKIKGLKDRLLQRLVDKGIIRKEEQKILWVFPNHKYPTLDPAPELEVRETINDVVLNYKTPDEEKLALVALIQACDLINEVFEKDQRKKAKKRIKEILKDESLTSSVSKAVRDAVDEISAAVAVAAVIVVTSGS